MWPGSSALSDRSAGRCPCARCTHWEKGDPVTAGGKEGGTGTHDGGQGPGDSRWRPGGGESGSRLHLPHLAVGGGEHPHLVDQHAATVELTALEQGHLPGVGALCAWNSFDDPLGFISVWMETWRRMWAASIWPRSKVETSADGSAETEPVGERRAEAETARRAEATGARPEELQVRVRRGRGSRLGSPGERLVSMQPRREPGSRQKRLSSSWEEAAAGEGS